MQLKFKAFECDAAAGNAGRVNALFLIEESMKTLRNSHQLETMRDEWIVFQESHRSANIVDLKSL